MDSILERPEEIILERAESGVGGGGGCMDVNIVVKLGEME